MTNIKNINKILSGSYGGLAIFLLVIFIYLGKQWIFLPAAEEIEPMLMQEVNKIEVEHIIKPQNITFDKTPSKKSIIAVYKIYKSVNYDNPTYKKMETILKDMDPVLKDAGWVKGVTRESRQEMFTKSIGRFDLELTIFFDEHDIVFKIKVAP